MVLCFRRLVVNLGQTPIRAEPEATVLAAAEAAAAFREAAETAEPMEAAAVSVDMVYRVALPETAEPTAAEEVPLARTLAGLAGHLAETADTQT